MGPAASDVPADAPPACPGTTSEAAGTTDACVGCPNATACASGSGSAAAGGEGAPTAEAAALASRMRRVRHKLLVLSGKGGVGKSTLAAQLAMALASGAAADAPPAAANGAGGVTGGDGGGGLDGGGGGGGDSDSAGADAEEEPLEVGLLDVDICGPSAPHLLGVTAAEVRQTAGGWEPVYAADNLAVMSIGFMLPASDEAIIWRGARKTGLIRQFLRDVAWGELDYLVVDAPPGTSDEHISLVQALMAKPTDVDGGPSSGGVTAAIIVTTPQEVSLLDVRKGISFCTKAGLPVLGVVENMAGFVCPHCAGCTDIFAPSSGGAAALAAATGVPLLGRIPLDPALGAAGERGVSAFAGGKGKSSSPGVAALRSLVGAVKAAVAATEARGVGGGVGGRPRGGPRRARPSPRRPGRLCIDFAACAPRGGRGLVDWGPPPRAPAWLTIGQRCRPEVVSGGRAVPPPACVCMGSVRGAAAGPRQAPACSCGLHHLRAAAGPAVGVLLRGVTPST